MSLPTTCPNCESPRIWYSRRNGFGGEIGSTLSCWKCESDIQLDEDDEVLSVVKSEMPIGSSQIVQQFRNAVHAVSFHLPVLTTQEVRELATLTNSIDRQVEGRLP